MEWWSDGVIRDSEEIRRPKVEGRKKAEIRDPKAEDHKCLICSF